MADSPAVIITPNAANIVTVGLIMAPVVLVILLALGFFAWKSTPSS